MSRPSVLVLHAGYWTSYVALLLAILTLLQLRDGRASGGWPVALTLVVMAALTVPNVFAFYASHARLFPLLHQRRPWRVTAGKGVLIGGVAALLAFAILHAGAGAPPLPLTEWPSFAALVLCLMVLAAGHIVLALGVRGFLAWSDGLRDREARHREAHALELALLRSRLDPHFLFNTLNNIDVLIEKDPPLASAYLQKMSELMRYVLFEAGTPRVPLAAELAHMARYLEIESLRHADPRYATFEVVGDASGLAVPPTLFMPFVENAFKHGARHDGAQVRVRCEIGAGEIVFRCTNGCRADEADAGRPGGLGHALARRRLELLYPGRHALKIERAGGDYSLSLTIRTDDDLLPDR